MGRLNFCFTEGIMTIYTTGAFLRPIKTKNCNGEDVWGWVVSEFTDDSYQDGEICNPNELAKSQETLLNCENDSMEKDIDFFCCGEMRTLDWCEENCNRQPHCDTWCWAQDELIKRNEEA
jgi:hypothetical protein